MRASILSIATALACQFTFSSQASALGKMEVVSECLQHIESGDLDAAKEVAAEVRAWRYLYGTKLIKDAEVCLSQATNEQWKYMPTKSSFLSGQELIDEKAFIAAAATRKETREKFECQRLQILEAYGSAEEAKKEVAEATQLKAQLYTFAACRRLAEEDFDTALLNAVCSQVFHSMGVPGTPYSEVLSELSELQEELLSDYIRISKSLGEYRGEVVKPDLEGC